MLRLSARNARSRWLPVESALRHLHSNVNQEVDSEVTSVQRELCAAALPHVPSCGWTKAALLAGAKDLSLSPAIIGILPRQESNLVEYVIEQHNARLAQELQQLRPRLEGLRTPQRVATAVRMRLEMLIPYINSWPQALAILARPHNSLPALQLLASLIDDIWYAAGDTSTDASWYTKRLLLGGVYTSTEMYMLTDFSPGFEDTWAHLDRRLQDVAALGQAAKHLSAAGQGLFNALDSLRHKQAADGQGGAAAAHPGSSDSSSSSASHGSRESTGTTGSSSTDGPQQPPGGLYAQQLEQQPRQAHHHQQQ